MRAGRQVARLVVWAVTLFSWILAIGCASAPLQETIAAVVIDRDAPSAQGEPWRVTIATDDGRYAVIETSPDVWRYLYPGLRVVMRRLASGDWRIEWGGDPAAPKPAPSTT